MSKSDWTPVQLQYMAMLADPTKKRSQKQIAGELGVSTRTLQRWQRKEGFWDIVDKSVKTVSDQALSSVWSALINKAVDGDVSAIRLYFQLRGELVEKRQEKLTVSAPETVVIKEKVSTGGA